MPNPSAVSTLGDLRRAVERGEIRHRSVHEEVRDNLNFLSYVPVLFVSALTKQRVHRILPTVLEVAEARNHRLSTSEVNNIIREAYDGISPGSDSAFSSAIAASATAS